MRRIRPAARARATSLAVASLAIAGWGCHDRAASQRDAASDGPQAEAVNPLTLNIGVTGCSQYEPSGGCNADGGVGPCCTGAPPLALSFAPVGAPDLTMFQWDFGDGTPTTTERAPAHAYPRPGVYQVTLVAGGPDTGALNPPHPLTVAVEAVSVGGPCDVDAQCDDGLTCTCGRGSGCPAAFVRGFCSTTCDDDAACGAGAVCAGLSILPAGDGGAGALTPRCFTACQGNSDCAAGSICEALPASPASAAAPWTSGCLPLGLLQDVGGPCRDANELLDDQACTTGMCADVGALGVCSADCGASLPCPDSAACVQLADGRQLCLQTCTSGGDCTRDPLLGCAPTARAGGSTGDIMVCAPRGCTTDATCAPSGRCGPDGVCVRR